MNAINVAIELSNGAEADGIASISEPMSGSDLNIGDGFRARSFRAAEAGEAMDPLVMVDHYVMTEPTFGTHPHAGMSAVSLLFEDSEGLFHNRDSLGNDFDLQPGDLYWLSAGRGALHNESPRPAARIHGLQVFVNVPQVQRFDPPVSLLVRSTEMPVITNTDSRVKVVLGESNGVCGVVSPSISMTILDGTVRRGGTFSHQAAPNRGIWVQSVEGRLDVVAGEKTTHLDSRQGVAIKTNGQTNITIRSASDEPVHFAMFDGAEVAETYVQDGPFVMGSLEQIATIKADYESGQLGSIPDDH